VFDRDVKDAIARDGNVFSFAAVGQELIVSSIESGEF